MLRALPLLLLLAACGRTPPPPADDGPGAGQPPVQRVAKPGDKAPAAKAPPRPAPGKPAPRPKVRRPPQPPPQAVADGDGGDVKRKRSAAAPLVPGTATVSTANVAPDGPPARVSVSGDAAAVTLMRSRQKYQVPGRIEPGDYTIVATFEAGHPVSAGSLHVAPEAELTIHCSRAEQTCSGS